MKRILGVLLFGAILALTAYANVVTDLGYSPAQTSGAVGPIQLPGSPQDAVIWTNITDAPFNVGRSAGGCLNNQLYIFTSEDGPLAIALNTTTESWVFSTLPPDNYYNAASAANSSIYLIGGYNAVTGQPVNVVRKFTPSFVNSPTGFWSPLAPLPIPLYGATASWNGADYIYVTGGHTLGGVYSLATFRYSISLNSWTQLQDVPEPMSFSGSAYVGDRFHVFGGTDVTGLGKRHWAYDPFLDIWEAKADVPNPVWFATSSTTHNENLIYSVGGGGGYGPWPATNAVQIYDHYTNTWVQETPLPISNGLNFACYSSPSRIYSIGGFELLNYQVDAYRGDGFPLLAMNLQVTMDPLAPPIVIPANGGSFQFHATALNAGPFGGVFWVWARVEFPDGTLQAPSLGPLPIAPPVGFAVERTRTQNVPNYWPSGVYRMIGYVGLNFPGPIVDEESDNGIGIPEDQKHKIFGVFRRVRSRETGSVEGKGVGLSSVKTIVEMYGGEIWVESQLGVGSTFYFTMNRTQVNPEGRQDEEVEDTDDSMAISV